MIYYLFYSFRFECIHYTHLLISSHIYSSYYIVRFLLIKSSSLFNCSYRHIALGCQSCVARTCYQMTLTFLSWSPGGQPSSGPHLTSIAAIFIKLIYLIYLLSISFSLYFYQFHSEIQSNASCTKMVMERVIESHL